MATPIGTDVVTSLSRRRILPMITDNVYGSNPFFYRASSKYKKMVQGGTQIEAPMIYKRFTNGGPFQGYDVYDVAPNDTVKNGAWDWKQHQVSVTVDGLTLIKTDSPESIANFITHNFQQAEEEMAENLGTGLWSDGTTNAKEIDGLEAVVDDGGVAPVYGGLTRASNTWLNAVDDTTAGPLSLATLQTFFGNVGSGGRQPTLFISRQEQYNRFYALNIGNQRYPSAVGGQDEQLASAGFSNLLFNGVPWVVDSHCFDGPNTSNSAIVALCEDYLHLVVSPRADFYLKDFQSPIDQDVMTASLFWAGNLICTAPQRQGKLSNIAS